MLRLMQIAVLAVVLTASASVARADLTPVGDPFEGDSWGQRFVGDVGSYDLIAVRMTSAGSSFESPTFRNFSLSGWATRFEKMLPKPTIAVATGPTTSNLQFDIVFAGAKSTPLQFDFVALNGNTIVDNAHAIWNGGGWSFPATSWKPSRAELMAIPAPAAIALGMFGLGLVGWLKRRVG